VRSTVVSYRLIGQTEPTSGSIFSKLHTSSMAEIGSRYLTMLLGSDLSQPTSTSRKMRYPPLRS